MFALVSLNLCGTVTIFLLPWYDLEVVVFYPYFCICLFSFLFLLFMLIFHNKVPILYLFLGNSISSPFLLTPHERSLLLFSTKRYLSRWRPLSGSSPSKKPLRFSKRFDLPGLGIMLPLTSGWPFILVYFVALIPLLAALVAGLTFFFWDVTALGLHLYIDYTKVDPSFTLTQLESLLSWLKSQGVRGTSLASTSTSCCKTIYDIGFLVYLLGLAYSSFRTQRYIITNSSKVHWSITLLLVFIFLVSLFALLAVGVIYILFGVPGM